MKSHFKYIFHRNYLLSIDIKTYYIFRKKYFNDLFINPAEEIILFLMFSLNYGLTNIRDKIICE